MHSVRRSSGIAARLALRAALVSRLSSIDGLRIRTPSTYT